jgi:hypothetical protein
MKDSSVLALIVAVYTALAMVFYVVTTVKIGRPFLIPLVTAFLENWKIE